jgi:ADP-ribosyl-[dinitrogen reductase] hydrolase
MDKIYQKLEGAFIGLAVGDAVGTTLEFKTRDTYTHITDMVGGGPFNLPIGYWTDDTSMALCLAESLIMDSNLDKMDLLERFTKWYDKGYNSPLGYCFDIGNTTRSAILEFKFNQSLTNNADSTQCGNGSIMRLSPAVIAHYDNKSKAIDVAIEQGKTTHASIIASQCCEILAEVLFALIHNNSKSVDIVQNGNWLRNVSKVLNAQSLSRNEVKSSGYCVDTLEAALWAFYQTDSFRDCILLAVNLGNDADTVGAVAGQIAGAYYGIDDIPQEWINKLYNKEYLVKTSQDLYSR